MILTRGIKTFSPGDFPGRPVVRTLHFNCHCWRWGFSPSLGNPVSCATWPEKWSFKVKWLKKNWVRQTFCSDCFPFPFQFSSLLPFDRACVFYPGNCPLALTPPSEILGHFLVMTRNLLMTFKDLFIKFSVWVIFALDYPLYNYVYTFRSKQNHFLFLLLKLQIFFNLW